MDLIIIFLNLSFSNCCTSTFYTNSVCFLPILAVYQERESSQVTQMEQWFGIFLMMKDLGNLR